MENKLVESRLTLPRLALVIPCYNEEEVLPETSRRLIILLNQLIDQQLVDRNSYVLLVDDVITTGATLEACARTILQDGNVNMSIFSLAYTSA